MAASVAGSVVSIPISTQISPAWRASGSRSASRTMSVARMVANSFTGTSSATSASSSARHMRLEEVGFSSARSTNITPWVRCSQAISAATRTGSRKRHLVQNWYCPQ